MFTELMNPLFNGTVKQKAVLFVLLLVLNLLIYWLVYATGGSRYVYAHSMYIPIVLGATIFGPSGGIFFGMLGGILLGPFMPLDTTTGEQQELINWAYRLIFFSLIGVLVGVLTALIKRNIHEIEWNLKHNDISGAPNRRSLISDIQSYRPVNSSRLYMILLKNLYDLENSLGYEVIPVVINSLKRTLIGELSFNVIFYHPKSNHIALLIENLSCETYSTVERELRKKLQNPIDFNGIPLLLEFVCGSSDLSSNQKASVNCIRQAEICVAQALLQNISWLHYSNANQNISKRNIELLGFFKESLAAGSNLSLDYQPKYDLRTGKITGVESLIRWNHHKMGMVSPAEFIPVIEKSQLINPMTYWVLDRALSDFSSFRKSGVEVNKISVNISSSNLLDPDFCPQVLKLLEKHNVPAASLEFEVTESAIVNDYKYCNTKLIDLSKMGILISIDDFGTGYSSLQHIANLPFNLIKIDQIFIKNLTSQPQLVNIVKAVIDMAHQLGAVVVAEGIEDKETEELLKDLNCDQGQGFHFSRPLHLEQLGYLFKTSDQGASD